MAQNVLAGLTAKLLKEYPGLAVNLVTGIPAPDLIADGLDVVIRVGALQDSSLFSVDSARCRWLCAPPSRTSLSTASRKTRRSQ